jgi:hypothetical protein
MVEGRGGERVRDREGLRVHEGAYCVEKEIENGRGRGRGDPASYTHPPTHPHMSVCAYIYYVLICTSKLFCTCFPLHFCIIFVLYFVMSECMR